VRDGRLGTNIGSVATLDDAVAALNPTKRRNGKTIIRIRPEALRRPQRPPVTTRSASAPQSVRVGSCEDHRYEVWPLLPSRDRVVNLVKAIERWASLARFTAAACPWRATRDAAAAGEREHPDAAQKEAFRDPAQQGKICPTLTISSSARLWPGAGGMLQRSGNCGPAVLAYRGGREGIDGVGPMMSGACDRRARSAAARLDVRLLDAVHCVGVMHRRLVICFGMIRAPPRRWPSVQTRSAGFVACGGGSRGPGLNSLRSLVPPRAPHDLWKEYECLDPYG
jgi:hypothetical protein